MSERQAATGCSCVRVSAGSVSVGVISASVSGLLRPCQYVLIRVSAVSVTDSALITETDTSRPISSIKKLLTSAALVSVSVTGFD